MPRSTPSPRERWATAWQIARLIQQGVALRSYYGWCEVPTHPDLDGFRLIAIALDCVENQPSLHHEPESGRYLAKQRMKRGEIPF